MSGSMLSSWPWERLGSLKYILYGPFLGGALYSWMREDGRKESLYLHILIICGLRGFTHQLWFSFSNLLFLTRNRIINRRGVDFEQIDREWHWDNFIILHAFMAVWACYSFPLVGFIPLWNWRGCIFALLLHMGVSEPLYYFLHRSFHRDFLFTEHHSVHHSSVVTQSYTAGHATPLEHFILGVIMSIPLVGPTLMGCGSVSLFYGYVLMFDFLRCMGHSNVEVIPHQLFESFPLLRYLLYTATYHSLHHTEMGTNYCLFMPLYDKLGSTLNDKSWDLHKKITSVRNSAPPDFVFLAHAVDAISSVHVPFFMRSVSALPYTTRLALLPFWPVSFLTLLIMWASAKTYLHTYYQLKDHLQQTWVVPRAGFQYFLPFAKDGINSQIEQAILRADRLGVKVLSLAALNKNESLNGGGMLFVKTHPDLKVRLVHGNTLTAAVILDKIDGNVVEEVFLTGATSKLGRAIALYLCRRKIRVMMLTPSAERFEAIKKEASVDVQQYLVHVTKYQAARNCKTWIVGKWLPITAQMWAPPGTHFHQFVVPPVTPYRSDCTYGELAAMKLPKDVQGLGSCEYTLGRGVIHACHAGGLVHYLEGWSHHEVGAIDVDRIDLVWQAALKHGLRPV